MTVLRELLKMLITHDFDSPTFFEKIVGREEQNLISSVDLQDLFGSEKILIIGASGTIGSSIAKRLMFSNIESVFLLDRDESALHALNLQLSGLSASLSKNCFISDIRDPLGIRSVISKVQPTIVIHAAALKHLVMLERFPREGYLSNIIGTLNVASACEEFGVRQFVNISTDKAAKPISVLGKTKKISELITEEVFRSSASGHCSVRFGNVFASRGSVIETFIHQIKNGLPVTVTDKKVARFFMSHNEAANLVLAAASLRENGTYIQNMGEEVPIIDVVNRIAEYFFTTPVLNYIGLQEGEKLHEELYDGPTTPTKFAAIARSVHGINIGLVKDIKTHVPENNEEAIERLDELASKYIWEK